MKIVKTILAILVPTFLFISCNNDDATPLTPVAPAPVAQNPFPGYLAATGFNQNQNVVSNAATYYEYGFSFKPKVTGKITAIVAKLPDDVNVRVTIWDKQAGIPYKTGILNVTQTAIEFTQVVDIDLVKGKEYMITVNSNDWYTHAKSDASETTYPLTVGNIEVTGYGYKEGSAQEMPNTFVTNYCLGDLSFKFLQTE